jgi:hypothetical protein
VQQCKSYVVNMYEYILIAHRAKDHCEFDIRSMAPSPGLTPFSPLSCQLK